MQNQRRTFINPFQMVNKDTLSGADLIRLQKDFDEIIVRLQGSEDQIQLLKNENQLLKKQLQKSKQQIRQLKTNDGDSEWKKSFDEIIVRLQGSEDQIQLLKNENKQLKKQLQKSKQQNRQHKTNDGDSEWKVALSQMINQKNYERKPIEKKKFIKQKQAVSNKQESNRQQFQVDYNKLYNTQHYKIKSLHQNIKTQQTSKNKNILNHQCTVKKNPTNFISHSYNSSNKSSQSTPNFKLIRPQHSKYSSSDSKQSQISLEIPIQKTNRFDYSPGTPQNQVKISHEYKKYMFQKTSPSTFIIKKI